MSSQIFCFPRLLFYCPYPSRLSSSLSLSVFATHPSIFLLAEALLAAIKDGGFIVAADKTVEMAAEFLDFLSQTPFPCPFGDASGNEEPEQMRNEMHKLVG